MATVTDVHNNKLAREGCDHCRCGVKYWENDVCVDCGTNISELLRDPEWMRMNRLEAPFGVWSWASNSIVLVANTRAGAEQKAIIVAINSGRSTEVLEAV